MILWATCSRRGTYLIGVGVESREYGLCHYESSSMLACVAAFPKKHAKGTKLRASAKNKFLLTPGVLFRSPACSLACSISLPGKGKETAATQATSMRSHLFEYFFCQAPKSIE